MIDFSKFNSLFAMANYFCDDDICKQTIIVNYLVMEDLDNGFGNCYIKDKDNIGINYNRKVKFLGLSSLKNEVEHIARKYDIALSTVQANYTSKMCPICGCIDDENRPNQETSECVECGNKDNADLNAKNRVCVTVLRDSFLRQRCLRTKEPQKRKGKGSTTVVPKKLAKESKE